MAEEDWGNGGVPSYSQPSDDTVRKLFLNFIFTYKLK